MSERAPAERSARPAVFLDRDGTLNEDRGFVHRVQDLALYAGVVEALAALKRSGFLLLVVTNQSGVARGLYSEQDVRAFHEGMNAVLRPADAAIDAFYFCPYHPEATVDRYRIDSPLRKPNIGMFEQALRDFPIQRELSFMVGDRLADMAFGAAAGLKSILVRTGHGEAAARSSRDAPFAVVGDFAEAAGMILAQARDRASRTSS